MKKTLISVMLFLTAVYLGRYILPIGLAYGIIRSLFISKGFQTYMYTMALAIDQLACVVMKYLFNDILIKKGGQKFGNPDTTISGVLGRNQKSNTLTKVGKGLNWILNKLEPNHSILCIEQDEKTETK